MTQPVATPSPRPHPLRPPGSDVVLALVLWGIGQLEIWVLDTFEGPRGWAVAAMTLTAAPLAWRRRAPLAMCLAVAAALGVTTPASGLSEFLAVLVAVFSVGAHAALRPAALGLASVVVAQTTAILVSDDPTVANALYAATVYAAAWLAGVAVRRRAVQVVGLRSLVREMREDQERATEAALAAERMRIARELHDLISHSVAVMVVQAGAAEELLLRDPVRAREALEAVQATGEEAAAELRRLLGVLRGGSTDVTLDPQPGLGALPELVAQLRRSGLDVALVREGAGGPLPPGVDLAAYRLVQESLTNVVKHSRATTATVTVRVDPDAIQVRVTDPGPGRGRSAGEGHGLIGMRERCALYGGVLTAGPAGQGFEVTALLPRDAEATGGESRAGVRDAPAGPGLAR